MWCKTCGAIRTRCDCRLSSLTNTQPTREEYSLIATKRFPGMRAASEANEWERFVDAYTRDMNTPCLVHVDPNIHYPYVTVHTDDDEPIDVYLADGGVAFTLRGSGNMLLLSREKADKLGNALKQAATFRRMT